MEIDQTAIRRILIINLAFIGDVLLSTPVARALRQRFPQARIDMLTVPLAAPIARGNPYVDLVWEYDKRGKHKKTGELYRLIRQLRSESYDLAVTTNFAPRGAMLAWLTGIRYRIGYDAQHAGWFLTHRANPRRLEIRHEAENYLDVLAPLGISGSDTSLALNVKAEDIATLQGKLKRSPERSLAVFCPVGSYPQKSWTAGGFAEIIRRVLPWADCYLVGGQREAGQLEEINTLAGNAARVLAGTLTLGELAALLAEATFLLTVDTGPLHIANAVGTPIVALFGPTDPRVWGPRGARDIVLQKAPDCAPCWGKKPCSDRRCMNQFSIDEVMAAVLNAGGGKLMARQSTADI